MPQTVPPPARFRLSWAILFKPGWTAFRTYWKLFVAVQICAVTMVALYYGHAGIHEWCERLAVLKVRGGLFFAAVSTLASGGLFPELLKWQFRPPHLPKPSWGELIHQVALFPLLGMLVDLFYRFQSAIFGDGLDFWTLFVKICVDQLIFSPLVGAPIWVTWFFWRESRYSLNRMVATASLDLYLSRAVPLYASSLSYWPVMLIFIYSLPAALQFPLFLFANSAWSLIAVFIARRQVDRIEVSPIDSAKGGKMPHEEQPRPA